LQSVVPCPVDFPPLSNRQDSYKCYDRGATAREEDMVTGYTHRALNPMYFENAGHMGGVTEDDIQRISVTLPKFPVCFGDVILRSPPKCPVLDFKAL
jgi:hypothetical protein